MNELTIISRKSILAKLQAIEVSELSKKNILKSKLFLKPKILQGI